MAPKQAVASLYWHDYETTGTDPARDRVIQFAGTRTDTELRLLETSPSSWCRLSDDVLPDPEAVLVTGLGPDRLQMEGQREVDFIRGIVAELSRPGTCACGYNNLRFDDEFTRHTLYRNLLDPYAREWQAGNSRWDLIDALRMAHALRPEGINWPTGPGGVVSFRLAELARANGLVHTRAHDAGSDVEATIALAALLRRAQPRLFAYLFELRQKQKVVDLCYPLGKTPLLHVSAMYPAARFCLALVLPLAQHPNNGNGIIAYDLGVDPDPLIGASPAEIRRLVFTPEAELEVARIPLKTIHINRCPALAPLSTLRPADAGRLGIELDESWARVRRLQGSSGLVARIQEAFAAPAAATDADPDLLLYTGGFFGPHDRRLMEEVHRTDPSRLASKVFDFKDPRLPEMLFRFRARNYPEFLTAAERARWDAWRAGRWAALTPAWLDRLSMLEAGTRSQAESGLLAELRAWAQQIGALQSKP